MKRNVLLVLTISMVLGLASCGDPNEDVKKLPGQFAVQADNSRSVMARNAASLGPYTINTARTIYFYLKNIGDYPITDIALSLGKYGSDFEPIGNNDFVVFPTSINQLVSSKTSSVDTFIELNVNHGHIIGSVAQSNVISKDVEGVTIRITGMTTDGEKDIPVSLDVNVDTLIKVASFDIVYGDDYTVATKYGEISPGWERYGYLVPSSQIDKVRLHNTGNVDISVKIGRIGAASNFENLDSWEEVLSNAYSELFTDGTNQDLYCFIVDTKGVVFDNKSNNDLVFRVGTSIVQSKYNLSASLQAILIYKDY